MKKKMKYIKSYQCRRKYNWPLMIYIYLSASNIILELNIFSRCAYLYLSSVIVLMRGGRRKVVAAL